MSPKANALHGNGLSPTVLSMHGSKRAIARIREEMEERGISQRDLADMLNRRDRQIVWTQSKVGKVLAGRVKARVDDVELMADVIGLRLSEVVRDRGLEFYAEMTPTEVRILERLRQRPQMLDAVRILLDVQGSVQSTAMEPTPAKRGRPRNSARKLA